MKTAAEKLQKMKQIDQKSVKSTQEKMTLINDSKVSALQIELDTIIAKTFEKQCVGQDVYTQDSNYLLKVLTEQPNGVSKITTSSKVTAEDANNSEIHDLNKLIQYFEN